MISFHTEASPDDSNANVQGVGEPRKYLGHGICDARSKLSNLPKATDASESIKMHAIRLLREARVPPAKIRGIGLQMTRLDDRQRGGDGNGGALRGWLVAKSGDNGSGPNQSAVGSAVRSRLSPLVEPGRSASAGTFGDDVDTRTSRQKRLKLSDSYPKGGADREANHKHARGYLDQSDELAVETVWEDARSSETCEVVSGVGQSDEASQKTDGSMSVQRLAGSNLTNEDEAKQTEIPSDHHGRERHGNVATPLFRPALSTSADNSPTIEARAEQAEAFGDHHGQDSESTHGSPRATTRLGNNGTPSSSPVGSVIELLSPFTPSPHDAETPTSIGTGTPSMSRVMTTNNRTFPMKWNKAPNYRDF